MKEIEEFKKEEEITTLQVYEDTSRPNIEMVPCEIMHIVFDFLDGETMLNIPLVNRRFKEVFNLFDKKIISDRVMPIIYKNPEETDTSYLKLIRLLQQNKSLIPFNLELNTKYMNAEFLFGNKGIKLISTLTGTKKLTLNPGYSVSFSMERGDEYYPLKIDIQHQREKLLGPDPEKDFAIPFNDSKLYNITENMFYLEELNIKACVTITDVGMMYLGIKCPNIKHLNISYC